MADTCQTTLTENVKINKWTDGAQSIGCFEYCGFYYINMITGNSDRPDLGVGTGSYKGGYDFCGLVAQVAKMHIPDIPDAPMPCPANQKAPEVSEDQKIINSFVNSFMGFVDGITQYDPAAEYACNDWVIFEGALNKSLIDENTRHPHDKDSWKNYVGIADILTVMFDEQSGHQVTLPYFNACGDEGCVMPYGLGACVVVKTPAKDQLGNPVLDNCGNPVFDELIHTSLVENNITEPVSGSVADPATWSAGMTACEYFNRPIGVDENGNPITPGGEGCYVSCSAPLAPLMWVYADANNNVVTIPDGADIPDGVTRRLTVDLPDDVYVVGVNDSGTTTELTMSDGSVVSGPRIDNDDYVVLTTATKQSNGDTLVTLTLSSGATVSHTIIAKVACSLDYLTPKILPKLDNADPNALVIKDQFERKYSTLAAMTADIGADGSGGQQLVWEKVISKAQLDAIGVRPTDNAVEIELSANGRIANLSGTMTSDINFESILKIEGCDGFIRGVDAYGVNIRSFQSTEDEGMGERISVTAPLAADGSITVRGYLDSDYLTDEIEEVEFLQKYIIRKSFRADPANMCYQAANPDCLGVLAGS